jgi:hypothetical protein
MAANNDDDHPRAMYVVVLVSLAVTIALFTLISRMVS